MKQELANPHSDASFAFRLGWLAPEEQDAAIWKWKNGNREMVRTVLKMALLSQDDLWDRESWWRWNIFFPLREKTRYGTVHARLSASEPTTPAALQRAAELINDYFAPAPDEHLRQTSLCVQIWQQHSPLSFGVYHDSPTMHERLEAKLCWRDWQIKMGG